MFSVLPRRSLQRISAFCITSNFLSKVLGVLNIFLQGMGIRDPGINFWRTIATSFSNLILHSSLADVTIIAFTPPESPPRNTNLQSRPSCSHGLQCQCKSFPFYITFGDFLISRKLSIAGEVGNRLPQGFWCRHAFSELLSQNRSINKIVNVCRRYHITQPFKATWLQWFLWNFGFSNIWKSLWTCMKLGYGAWSRRYPCTPEYIYSVLYANMTNTSTLEGNIHEIHRGRQPRSQSSPTSSSSAPSHQSILKHALSCSEPCLYPRK